MPGKISGRMKWMPRGASPVRGVLRLAEYFVPVFIAALLLTAGSAGTQPHGGDIPHLEKSGAATRLIVDGKPFLILGGELGNSTASSIEYFRSHLKKFAEMNLNTLLVPAYWELIEPQEGSFDFTLVDSAIYSARRCDLRIVFLWFGSWKNSMSCYAPLWMKEDWKRFTRAHAMDGRALDIFSPFVGENRDADARAFAALMAHIREVDSGYSTVIMVQVENEIGMIPEARDYSEDATAAFTRPVPSELITYLVGHRDSLHDDVFQVWKNNGFRSSGSWEEMFGKGTTTDEIFMAWNFGRYVNHVAAAGKREYPIPMYVNAALIRPGYRPGEYPSAGPLPHIMDIWKAAAPEIDFLAPDIYFANFAEWCDRYRRADNSFFIPECDSRQSVANAFYAIGRNDAMGYSPFSIESVGSQSEANIAEGYRVLRQLAPLLLENQGKGTMTGVLLDSASQKAKVCMGRYVFIFRHEYAWKYAKREPGAVPRSGGLIIMLSRNEFVIAGTGLLVTFETAAVGDSLSGLGSVYLGMFENGKWVTTLVLNGDQTNQGRQLFLPGGEFSIQKIKLFEYR